MIVLFNSSILLIIAGGHINVRNSKYDGNMDTFNEVRLIFIMYHMMLFTMYVSDLGVKVQIGYSCSFFVVFGLLVNMGKLIVFPIKACTKKCKVKYAKRKARKVRSVNKTRFQAKKFGERRIKKREENQIKMLALLKDFAKMRKEDMQAELQRRADKARKELQMRKEHDRIQREKNKSEPFKVTTIASNPINLEDKQIDDYESRQQANIEQP